MKKYDTILSHNLSKQLQVGKAGEHLVCCDLIQQGHSAFLADQGLPYDVIADINSKLFRIQVKTSIKSVDFQKQKSIYRFSLRSAIKGKRKIYPTEIDFVAFVALDIRVVAYMPVSKITSKGGYLTTCLEFRDKDIPTTSRVYCNGTVRSVNKNAKFIQDFSKIIV